MKYFKPANMTFRWRKATASIGNGACVEVLSLGGTVVVRDSKNPDGPMLSYSSPEWKAFVEGAKRGNFDLAS